VVGMQEIEQYRIREVKEHDLEGLIEMYMTLSERTLYFLRSNSFTPGEVREMHSRVDGEKIFSVVAVNDRKVLGEARLIRYSDTSAEFGIIVHDLYQNRGIGQALLKKIIEICREKRIKRLIGFCSEENEVALHIYKKYGFKVEKIIENHHSPMNGRVLRLSIHPNLVKS
jgi:L-amino acid N-acyltransferase YncA